MNTPYKFIFFLLITSVIFLCGCKTVYKSGFVSVPRQTFSGPIEIGSDWIEIIPPKPLIQYGTYSGIELDYPGYTTVKIDDKGQLLTTADGKNTRIEAFLFDDKGESYELKVDGEGSGIVLLNLEIPTDRTFTKLKIRSETSLKLNRIEWFGNNNY
jgi:hypothetical protein